MALGYQPSDLVKLSGTNAERIPGNNEIKQRILAEIEERRLAAFDKIIYERNRILAESKKQNDEEKVPKKNERFQKLKKSQEKEFEKLKQVKLTKYIKNKQAQEQQKADEDERKALIERKRHEKFNATAARIIADKENEKKHMERIAAKEREEREKREKLQKKYDDERIAMEESKRSPKGGTEWRRPEEIKKHYSNPRLDEMEKLRQEKAQNILLKQENALKKAELIRSQRLTAIKKRNVQQDAILTQRYQKIQNKYKQVKNSLLQQLSERDQHILDGIEEKRSKRDREILEKRKQTERAVKEARMRREQLENQRLDKLEDLRMKEDSIYDTRKEAAQKRALKLREIGIVSRKKANSILEAKSRRENERKEQISKAVKERESEVEKRIKEASEKRQKEIQKSMAENWMKQRNAEEKVRMQAIKEQFKNQQKVENIEKKMERINEEKKRQEEEKNAQNMRLKHMREENMSRLREMEDEIEANPDLTSKEIAEKFGVSLQ